MYTDEEIEQIIIEYREEHGYSKLSPSRLRSQVQNYARQLSPANTRSRHGMNDATAEEVVERLESDFTATARGELVRPHGFRARTTAQYGNPLYARKEVGHA